jgi:hypothetical protein
MELRIDDLIRFTPRGRVLFTARVLRVINSDDQRFAEMLQDLRFSMGVHELDVV